MSNGTKFNLLIALTLVCMWTCNYFRPKIVVDEIVLDSIHIPRKTCINVVNELLGKGIDSSKVCDCLIPKFYNLIKTDSTLVEKFKQSDGLFKLEGSLEDSAILLFVNCFRPNIIDTSYKFRLTPEYSLALKKKLKKAFILSLEFESIDADTFSNCIVDKLNGNITIGEYFADDYFEVPKIKKIMKECMEQSPKHKWHSMKIQQPTFNQVSNNVRNPSMRFYEQEWETTFQRDSTALPPTLVADTQPHFTNHVGVPDLVNDRWAFKETLRWSGIFSKGLFHGSGVYFEYLKMVCNLRRKSWVVKH